MGNGSYWDGANWSTVQVDSPFDKAKVFVQSVAPVDPTPMRTGDLFIDSDTRKVQFRDGTAWVDISAGLEIITISDVVDLSTTLDLKAPNDSPTFTGVATFSGSVAGITKSTVGLSNVDNTPDINKPISTVQQSALDLKAPINSPTFTGTVGGITKSMVGLSNVDNTSDASKPISTATQTALNGKANTIHTHLITDIPAITATAAELNFMAGVTSNVQTQLNGKQASGSYADSSHTHDDRYYTETETNSLLAGKSDTSHNHDSLYAITSGTNYGSLSKTNSPYNPSGGWIRFPDGTQICYIRVRITPTANDVSGPSWTFPVEFNNTPIVTVTAETGATTVLNASVSYPSPTSVGIQVYRTNDTNTYISAQAIGRWK